MMACLSIAAAISVVPAYASEPTVEASAMATVRGKVSFQRRNTVVPFSEGFIGETLNLAAESFCNGFGCPQSSPYWAVIVDDGTRRYEFHEAFALGASRAPQFVEIRGVAVHPGAEIAVVGSVEPVSPTYGIISEVRNVSLISNRYEAYAPMLDSVYGVEDTAWNCASSEDQDHSVTAYVWYGRRSIQENETFHLRVIAKRTNDPVHLQGVTDISNVQLKQYSGNIVYEGAIDDTSASLAIRRNSPQIHTYPSSLTISSAQGSLGVRMYCSPIVYPSNL
jgi:hypothetical protein